MTNHLHHFLVGFVLISLNHIQTHFGCGMNLNNNILNITIFQFLCSAGVKESLGQVINQHLDLQEMQRIRSTLQKVQQSIFYQIERDLVPSKVLVVYLKRNLVLT